MLTYTVLIAAEGVGTLLISIFFLVLQLNQKLN